uniref:JmjC domain-containing protein 4 n=1 Tax=Rhizophora mucronata TaxID=61149 RepID=A0A2P2IPL4_RHIMU
MTQQTTTFLHSIPKPVLNKLGNSHFYSLLIRKFSNITIRNLNSGFAKMGREEIEIGLAIFSDPIFASPPIIHEACQHHGFVLCHISFHKLIVAQLPPIHLFHLASYLYPHLQFLPIFPAASS